MAKAFGDSSMAEKFENVSLSHQTVARRVAHMDEHVRSELCNIIEKSVHFSLCLDDSTDQTDVIEWPLSEYIFSTHLICLPEKGL
jgi:hypothetical protein